MIYFNNQKKNRYSILHCAFSKAPTHTNDLIVSIEINVRQSCILSPCLFNFYAEYIMRNAGLEEAQLESRLQGEISIISDMQMTPPLWKKVKKNERASS